MKTVALTQGKVAVVDDDDYELVSKFTWHARRYKYSPSSREQWYALTSVGRSKIPMHRFITVTKPDELVDHRDHDGLNNRRKNLRVCSKAQNQRNLRSRAHSSQFKGVHWSKRMSKWVSGIQVAKKSIHLGVFTSEVAAATAYNEAASKHFGEFALLNKV